MKLFKILAWSLALVACAIGAATNAAEPEKAPEAAKPAEPAKEIAKEEVQIVEIKDTLKLEPRYVYVSERPAPVEAPRVKRVYFMGQMGYVIPGRPDTLRYFNGNGDLNMTNVNLESRPFVGFGIGLNSDSILRAEIQYFELQKSMRMIGADTVNNGLNIGSLGISGGSMNLFLDFADRRGRDDLFVPYIMGGIGASRLDYNKGFSISGANYSGTTLDKRTYILGAGVSIGFNTYVSLDIGYRQYRFGYTESGDIANELRSLSLEMAVIGLKLQI
ncbi:MAG: hypothetical protein LBL52_00260 [Rickettsiales bacterium]|jgi:opacity protein-like surface antigen|nr:hypothetical protein [Rickettsiales bacterium]